MQGVKGLLAFKAEQRFVASVGSGGWRKRHMQQFEYALLPSPRPMLLQDAESGTVLGVQLSRLHTCRPSDAEHASLLLSDDAGLRVHGSAAARGSIQKQFAVEGLAVYCQPRATAAPAGGAAAPQQRPDKQQQPRQLSYVLLPTDLVLHSTLQLSAGVGGGGDGGAAGTAGGMRVHAAAVVSHLELSLDGGQAADMLALSDRVAWCAARNRFAPYCPDGWRSPGPRAVPWRWGGVFAWLGRVRSWFVLGAAHALPTWSASQLPSHHIPSSPGLLPTPPNSLSTLRPPPVLPASGTCGATL